jgi:biopolymer transport protein ExbD
MAARRRALPPPAVPIAPLIDIVFQLLLFFMLVTNFLNPSLDLSLPSSTTARVNDQRSATVAITAAGSVYLNGQPIAWVELAPALRAQAAGVELVRVRADGATPHRDVVRAFDCIRAAGLTEVALEAEPQPGAP